MLSTKDRLTLTMENEGAEGERPSPEDWNHWELETAIKHAREHQGYLGLHQIAQIIAKALDDRSDIADLAQELYKILENDDRIDDHD